LTSFSYKNCTVSDVMGMPSPGYRFNILNERTQPVLSLVFERRDDAEQARGGRKGRRGHKARIDSGG
jgi:hypothetical protein